MKKWLSIALVAVLCLSLTACTAEETPDVTESTTTTTTASPYITEEQAITAAETHFGIQNGAVDEKTGFTMSYMVMQSPAEDKPVYVVALRWLVTVDGVPANWSTLDTVEIDAVRGTIRTQ